MIGPHDRAPFLKERRPVSFLLLVLLAGIADGPPVVAESPGLGLSIDPVVVTATRSPQLLGDTAGSVSVVEQQDLQAGRPAVGIDESLNRVPGLFAQSSQNFAQDVRLQIRGFGTRAAFGTREIKVLLDGLPETLPDGQTDLDAVDPGALGRVEVLRGPASSLYGNASGGVIQFFTEDGPDQPFSEARFLGGSYGLQKYQLKGGGRFGRARLFLHGSYTDLDGYRKHSATRSGVVNGKLRYSLSDNLEATLLLSAVDSPQAEDPGGLTRRDADQTPRRAAPLNVRLRAGEEVQQARLGTVVVWRAPRGELSTYAYGLYRNFGNRLPVLPEVGDGVVEFERLSPGAGARYALDFQAGIPQRLLIGADVQYQDDDRHRYANVAGRAGELRVHQAERVTGVGEYLRYAVYPLAGLEVSGGLRYDIVHYDVDVKFPSGSPAGGRRTLDAVSPGGGIVYAPLSWLSLFTTAGTAFQVPTTTELSNPTGPGFNPDLDPQKSLTVEGGVRAEWGPSVRAEASAFRIGLDDELIRYQAANGRDAFRNAGRSRRTGAELEGVVLLLPGLRWTSAFTFIDAEYRDYVTAAADFSGKAEPGIPRWRLFEELFYRHPSGLFAALDAHFVSHVYADDANLARSRGYDLVNLRCGAERSVGRWTFAPFVGLGNLVDARYDGLLRINAQGGRYFEPAPAVNAYGGLSVRASL